VRWGAVRLHRCASAPSSSTLGIIPPIRSIDAATLCLFWDRQHPGRVVKVGSGAVRHHDTRWRCHLENGENGLVTAVIDAVNGYAYFGASGSPGRVVKVALGGGLARHRVGAVLLESGEDSPKSAVIDATNGHAYFGTNTVLGGW